MGVMEVQPRTRSVLRAELTKKLQCFGMMMRVKWAVPCVTWVMIRPNRVVAVVALVAEVSAHSKSVQQALRQADCLGQMIQKNAQRGRTFPTHDAIN